MRAFSWYMQWGVMVNTGVIRIQKTSGEFFLFSSETSKFDRHL